MMTWKKTRKGSPAAWMGNGFGYSRSSGVYTGFYNGQPQFVIENRSSGDFREVAEWIIRRIGGGNIGWGWTLKEAKAKAEKWFSRHVQSPLASQEAGSGI